MAILTLACTGISWTWEPFRHREVTLYCQSFIWRFCRSQWPRGLRGRSTAAHLLRLWVRIPPGAWMSVCCDCCVLSGRGLCDELITRPEESYRLWCVVVCDLEITKILVNEKRFFRRQTAPFELSTQQALLKVSYDFHIAGNGLYTMLVTTLKGSKSSKHVYILYQL